MKSLKSLFLLLGAVLLLGGCTEYGDYPGGNYLSGYNGYYGGPIAPAYPPDDAGIPYPLPIPY